MLNDNEKISDQSLAWLAGIIDGEGCLVARFTNIGRYNSPGSLDIRITVESVSKRMIDHIQLIYVLMGIDHKLGKPMMHKKSTRIAHRIVVQKKSSVLTLIKNVRPYLVVKDREADELASYLVDHQPYEFSNQEVYEKRRSLVSVVKELKMTA